MNGTIQQVVGQESGFILTGRECFLDNWASNLDEYTCDMRKRRKVSVLRYLVDAGFIKQVPAKDVLWPDEYDDCYNNFYYKFDFSESEDANPVTAADMDVDGILYQFDDFIVIAPDGWN